MFSTIKKISGLALVGLTFLSPVSMAQVVGSKHDLTSNGTGQQGTAETTEVCVFCHTPHGAAIGASVPLWNKTLPGTGGFEATRYSDLNTSTLDGAEALVGSVSLACLSCHDGSQAMDVVINAPGSGLNSGQIDAGAVGAMTGTPVPMLGTDLRDDHPVSIQYAGGGYQYATSTFSGTGADTDFNAPQTAVINTNPIWWVDSDAGVDGTREKSDMMLYTRTESATVQPFVECGSCHDPHNNTFDDGTGVTTASVAFLRVRNDNSQICTACHTK